MEIELRPEQPSDYSETEFVTREAFWNHYSRCRPDKFHFGIGFILPINLATCFPSIIRHHNF